MYKKVYVVISLSVIALSLCGMSKDDVNFLETVTVKDAQAGRLFRYSVFYDLMQKTEHDFVNDAKHYGGIHSLDFSKYKPKNIYRTNAVDPAKSPFTLETVGELKQNFTDYKQNNAAAQKPGEIKILDAFDIWKNKGLMAALEETDIRYLQEVNPGAVFQLASNFNCLEGGVGKGTLSHMISMPVQGENAVLGTLGGGFIRKYLIPSEARNLLQNTNAQVSINGTVENKIDFKDSDIDNIAIGYHANVVVTSGYYPPFIRTEKDTLKLLGGELIPSDYVDSSQKGVNESNKEFFDDLDLRAHIEFLFQKGAVARNRNPVFVFNKLLDDSVHVDQVITSALNICKKRSNDGNDKSAKIILNAMYAGTILAAAVKGKKKVFLTMVGAGAFCNEPKWIMEALNQSIIKEAIAYTGMEVILVIYPDIRSGRGLDVKPYDSTGTPAERKKSSALPGIKDAVIALNKDIKNLFSASDGSLKALGSALKVLGA